MDGVVCSIHALIACFNWSGLYLDAGVEYYDQPLRSTLVRDQHHYHDGRNYGFGGYTEAVYTDGANYGYAAIGYEFGGDRLSFNLRATHNSSFDTGRDRGVNSVSFGFRWRPFAR